ncbi:MAG: aldehyde dehydrogenase family protein [Dehalococcoidia bacterium]
MVSTAGVRRLAEIADKPKIESRLFVDGRYVESTSGKTFATVYPPTNETLANVAEANAEDVERAIRAARREFDEGAWPRMSTAARAAVLLRLADLIDQNQDQLARLNTLDNGKTLRESIIDIQMGASAFRTMAYAAERELRGDTAPYDPNLVRFSLREPVGVVAGVVAFNAPMVFASLKAAPALAAGNTIVLKPSPYSSLIALRLAELGLEAGLPAGVLSTVAGGNETAVALAGHREVDMITLVGSVTAGEKMMELAARGIKKTLFELGGKSANIIFEDVDLDLAIDGAMTGIFRNCGQRCFSGSRLLVHKSIYDRVVSEVAAKASRLRLGDPFEESTQLGSLISRDQLKRVKGYVESALSEGAEVVTGGSQPEGLTEGNYYRPTVLAHVRNDMKVAREEIFGPVLSTIPFEDEADAIRIANDSDFGLAGGLWTRDLNRAHRVIRAVRTGLLWVNTYAAGGGVPMGAYKRSGVGEEGILAYTEIKGVVMDVTGATAAFYRQA